MVNASAEWRTRITMLRTFQVTRGNEIETVKLGKHCIALSRSPPPLTKMSPRTMEGKRLYSGYLVAQTSVGLYHISVLAAVL